ncbi:MAG: hypothetical protein P1U76_10240 [Thalassolituus oleivorans]|nr:hypothetical protein [Thalassolituus oleivorans]
MMNNHFRFMKAALLVISLCLSMMMSQLSLAAELQEVDNAIVKMLDAAAVDQNPDGSFTGAIESDPSIEVLFLLVAKELGKDTPELEDEVFHRVFSWKGEDVAWSFRPGGVPSIDVTGIILHGLEKLGINPSDERVAEAWAWFESQGGDDSLNLATVLLLKPIGLSTFKLDELLSPLFFALPQDSEINIWSIGILRNLLIPLIVQQFYAENNIVLPVLDRRIESNGSHLARPKKQRFKLFPLNFWAQEGLGYMIGHQQPDGNWYAFQAAYVNILMLNTVQKRGVYDVSDEIENAWNGMLKVKKTNINNEMFISVSDSTGWDTSRMLMALQSIPESFRDSMVAIENNRKGIDWLLGKQLFNKGDWSNNAPNLRPGGWSFVPDNIWLPDTDVTAAAVEALLSYKIENPYYRPVEMDNAISRGLEWTLGMQNDDGSFPAWDTDNTTYLPLFLSLLSKNPPDIEDVGQPDVTSRIIELLHDIDKVAPEFSSQALRDSIQGACGYLLSVRTQTEPSAWRGDWAVDYLYATGLAASALMVADCWSLSDAEQSLDWIASVQNDDGGWGEDHQSFIVESYVNAPSSAMQTGFIVEGFLTYEELYMEMDNEPSAYRPVLDQAMSYLISTVGDDGRIDEKSHTGVLLKQLWYADYAAVPDIRTINALGRYYKLISE